MGAVLPVYDAVCAVGELSVCDAGVSPVCDAVCAAGGVAAVFRAFHRIRWNIRCVSRIS